MGKLEVINELTAEDARLLPKPVREAILAEVATAPEVAVVTELRTTLGLDDKADIAKVVAELKSSQEQARKSAVSNRITELASDKDKGIKVESVRAVVVEMVKSRNPQDEAAAEAAFKEVSESEPIKELLKNAVVTTMGPPQRAAVQPQNGQAGKYFNIPAKD